MCLTFTASGSTALVAPETFVCCTYLTACTRSCLHSSDYACEKKLDIIDAMFVVGL